MHNYLTEVDKNELNAYSTSVANSIENVDISALQLCVITGAEWMFNKLKSTQLPSQCISVKDRFPEEEGCYLVFAPKSFPKNTKWVVAEFYAPSNTFYNESDEYPMNDVTHWMDLPDYPTVNI